MKSLSRNEMKNLKGGYIKPDGSCSESCGSGSNTASCSSATGKCSRDDTKGTITCDGTTYSCPGRP